jgi:hypothetical protein
VGEEKRANIRDWRTPSDLEGQDKNCLKEHWKGSAKNEGKQGRWLNRRQVKTALQAGRK